MKSLRVEFPNEDGHVLSGKLEMPLDRRADYFAIFAHCFTCGKDLRAERNITLALTQNGFGVLRFDFTGLGQSEGDFTATNFTTNVEDIHAAAKFLEKEYRSASLLIGHSLGGTAVILAGSKISSIKGIATIGAPSEPEHVLKLLRNEVDEIRDKGMANIRLAGRDFTISRQFITNLEGHGMKKVLDQMRDKALLIMHSPQDEVVEISNARSIYENAHHPKSFISLDGADHLLRNEEDSLYAGNIIGSWVQRYIKSDRKEKVSVEQVLTRLTEGPFLTEILTKHHHLLADEPKSEGGSDLGPGPYELVAAGLGACTAMTIKMYADRKEWPLEEVVVHLNYDSDYMQDCQHCENEDRKIGRFERIIEVKGNMSEEQKKRILHIANKCPVHKTLENGVKISSRLKIND